MLFWISNQKVFDKSFDENSEYSFSGKWVLLLKSLRDPYRRMINSIFKIKVNIERGLRKPCLTLNYSEKGRIEQYRKLCVNSSVSA